jgi:hypothetical protein
MAFVRPRMSVDRLRTVIGELQMPIRALPMGVGAELVSIGEQLMRIRAEPTSVGGLLASIGAILVGIGNR